MFSSFPWQQVQLTQAHGTNEHKEEEEIKHGKPKKITSDEAMLHNVEKVEEIKELRKENEVTFKNSNMTYTSEIYTGPVHYKEEGKLKPIKNTIIDNKDPDKDLFKYKNNRK